MTIVAQDVRDVASRRPAWARNAPAQYDKLAGRLDDYAGAWTDAYARGLCRNREPTRRDAMMACLRRRSFAEMEGTIVETMVTVGRSGSTRVGHRGGLGAPGRGALWRHRVSAA